MTNLREEIDNELRPVLHDMVIAPYELQEEDVIGIVAVLGGKLEALIRKFNKELLERVRSVIGEDEPEHSDIHTADMRYFSSTGLMLEKNKAKNNLRAEMRQALNKLEEVV